MDPQTIAGIGLPLAAGAGTLGFLGWNREMRQRHRKQYEAELARRKALREGSSEVRWDTELRRVEGVGQLSVLAVGTYAASILPFMLESFARAGATSYVGPIYLCEPDESERQKAMQSIPAEFKPRVIQLDCPNYSVGMSGSTIRRVLDNDALWRQDVQEGADRWLGLVQATTRTGLLLHLQSPGGSAGLGYLPARAYHQRYPDKPIYMVTILDEKGVVRQRFSEMRRLYSAGGLTRGFIITDNRHFKRRSDLGVAVLFAGAVGATWLSDQLLDPWNALAYVFPEDDPGRVATVSTWAETLPVYHLPAWEKARPGDQDVGEVYFTKASVVEEKAIRGIKQIVEDPALQSLPLERAPLGQTRFACVAAPIIPKPDYQRCARRVDQALEDWRIHDPNLSIQYGSLAAQVTSETAEVPIVAVLLQPLAGRPEDVDGFAVAAPAPPKPLVGAARRPEAQLPTNGAILDHPQPEPEVTSASS